MVFVCMLGKYIDVGMFLFILFLGFSFVIELLNDFSYEDLLCFGGFIFLLILDMLLSKSEILVGVIVGGVIGGLVVIGVVIVVIFFMFFCSKK